MNVFLGHVYFLEDDPVEKQIMRPYPPLGLLSVSAYLDKNGIEHHVFDGTFKSFTALKDQLIDIDPGIIGFYVNFLTRMNVIKTIRFIKESAEFKNIHIILGGPDVRYHAENYLTAGADYLVVGEGEETFYELITSLKNNLPLEKISGLIYHSENKDVIQTSPRSFISNLDDLPFPNRSKVSMEDYLSGWKKHQGYSSLTVNTQRGCPFSCNWCSHAVFGDTYRRRSPESVIMELAQLQETYNPDIFWFVDDVFTISETWLEKFTSLLVDHSMTISYECITRADRLSENALQLLQRSGCKMLWIGAESGSQNILNRMNRGVEATVVREKLHRAKELGIETGTFIMLGYPGERKRDIKETIGHLIEGAPDRFTINLAYPIKGTALFEEVQDSIQCNGDWENIPDRDLDYKREYPRKFYDFAVRYVYNSVWAEKQKKKKQILPYVSHKLKALASGLAMHIYS